jgi:hypothetical protein
MMKQSLTVFLCSTYADLREERERVLDAIRRLQFQHDALEFFGARAERSIETCVAQVRRSDVLVVIVGHCYGSVVAELGISYSEAEYREGYRLGKPCLVYVRDENVPVLPRHVERDPQKLRLLEAWKEMLTARHTVAAFADGHQLAVQVAADLGRTVQAIEELPLADTSSREDNGLVFGEVRGLLEEATGKGLSQRVVVSAWRRAVADLLASAEGRRPLVFLSYSYADKQVVRAVAEGMRAAEIDLWFDEAELELGDSVVKPGDSVVKQIEKGLDSADFVAFFLSKAAVTSSWMQHELNVAISRQLSERRGAIVLPVLLADVEIPALLKDVMYLDMRDGNIAGGVAELVRVIEHHLGELRAPALPVRVSTRIPLPWRPENFGGKTAAEIQAFFADELLPEGMERARRDWEGVEARTFPRRSVHVRSKSLSEKQGNCSSGSSGTNGAEPARAEPPSVLSGTVIFQ